MFLAVAAYQQLAEAVDCPLHLGITEAGGLRGGTVKSAIGIGSLLWFGIGDTIRVSLSAEPEEEVRVGFEILKALGIRNRGVRVVSCPSCARQGFDVIRTVEKLEERLGHIRTPMSLSVLGCVVNGPGEARETDIGITGGGQGKHMVYLSGVTDHHVRDEDMIDHIVRLVEAKAAEIEAAQIDTPDPRRRRIGCPSSGPGRLWFTMRLNRGFSRGPVKAVLCTSSSSPCSASPCWSGFSRRPASRKRRRRPLCRHGEPGLFESAPYKETRLQRKRDGHFYVTAYVEGTPVSFVVDTGATTVALTQEAARAVGLQFSPSEFEPVARTANGGRQRQACHPLQGGDRGQGRDRRRGDDHREGRRSRCSARPIWRASAASRWPATT